MIQPHALPHSLAGWLCACLNFKSFQIRLDGRNMTKRKEKPLNHGNVFNDRKTETSTENLHTKHDKDQSFERAYFTVTKLFKTKKRKNKKMRIFELWKLITFKSSRKIVFLFSTEPSILSQSIWLKNQIPLSFVAASGTKTMLLLFLHKMHVDVIPTSFIQYK